MSFLTDNESESLQIRRMILHVVGEQHDFEPQAELIDLPQSEFFL